MHTLAMLARIRARVDALGARLHHEADGRWVLVVPRATRSAVSVSTPRLDVLDNYLGALA